MPDVTLLVIAGVALWATLLVLVWAMCAAAARADGRDGRMIEGVSTKRPTVVADTGAIRERLQDALAVMEVEQLTVTVDIDGQPAVLATAPGVQEADDRQSRISVPVRVGEREVATLQAARAPGARRFDTGDSLMLRKVADGVAAAMQTERSSSSVPVGAPSAMA